jgi:UDP-glucose 4-epimerase
MTSVLITGANGFVGEALCAALQASGFDLTAAVRSRQSVQSLACNMIVEIDDINANTQWHDALQGIDVVIHLAARVHVMQENHADPLAEFRSINVEGTKNLARQAVTQGVRRFIYLSSIKVNGEQTKSKPFTADDKVNPEDPYGLSKWEAERILQAISAETGLETVIIRPPLIYGPGVKGNFLRLMKLLQNGWPIPLGRVQNKRSMVNLDNLCDLIRICIEHPAAKGEVFLVSDDQDLSTPELIGLLAHYLNKSAKLLPVPIFILRALAAVLGKTSEIDRLCSSLQIDIRKTQRLLDWQSPFPVVDGIKKTINHYVAHNSCTN